MIYNNTLAFLCEWRSVPNAKLNQYKNNVPLGGTDSPEFADVMYPDRVEIVSISGLVTKHTLSCVLTLQRKSAAEQIHTSPQSVHSISQIVIRPF